MTKGLIFDIRRFSVHDGPGIRTTLFFKGCPLACWWCHNPESREPRPESTIRHLKLDQRPVAIEETTGVWMTPEEVVTAILKDRIFFEESGGGVTLSGGEPLYQPDFLLELLRLLRNEGLHTAIDTCGFAREEDFRMILPWTDLFLFDLKHYDPSDHQRYTGVSSSHIHHNLNLLFQSGKQVIIRLPIIPGLNDKVESVLDFLLALIPPAVTPQSPVHLLPFHLAARNKYQRFGKENPLQGHKEMEKEELFPMKEALERAGFSVRIGG